MDITNNILNLNNNRLFTGLIEKEFVVEEVQIHVRVQQRNGRKCITTVENLDKIDNHGDKELLEKIAKYFRKNFNCSAILKKPENIIQLQGDKRNEIKDFILERKMVTEKQIKIHGF